MERFEDDTHTIPFARKHPIKIVWRGPTGRRHTLTAEWTPGRAVEEWADLVARGRDAHLYIDGDLYLRSRGQAVVA